MIENFIFSINIMLPLFLTILLGVWLRRKNLITEDVRSKLSTIVFYYALPCKLFMEMAASDLASGFDLKFVIYASGATLITFAVGWAFFHFTIPEGSVACACAHGCFRGNYAYVGIPVIGNILGTGATGISGIMIASSVLPMYNVLGVVLLSFYDPSGKKVSIGAQIRRILTNPMIRAILIGMPFALLRIPIPTVAAKTFNSIGSISGPIALLLIGANLNLDTFRSNPLRISETVTFKTVIFPLVFTGIAILLGFNTEQIITLFVVFSVPTATNTFIMAKDMGGDAELAAGIVMATSLVSMLTMTIGIFLLKTAGII